MGTGHVPLQGEFSLMDSAFCFDDTDKNWVTLIDVTELFFSDTFNTTVC